MDSFLQTFSKYIQSSDILILAVSGWVDSMVLFDLVKKNHPQENIIVAHFDHSLRWDESDCDREFVADICKKGNIQFEVKKVDIFALAKEEKMSIEAIARRERYSFLESVRWKYSAKYILTAHHRDDQVETILMNLIKWAKIRGLSWMYVLSGNIFRPLLYSSKDTIRKYTHDKGIQYKEDSTNSDTQYQRNNIRHNIIPLLKKINPRVDETLEEFAWYMQELWNFILEYTKNWLQNAEKFSWKQRCFLVSDFVLLDYFIQREIVVHLYVHAHYGSTQWLSWGIITEIIRFICEGSNSYGIKDIKNLHLERRGERVYYSKTVQER